MTPCIGNSLRLVRISICLSFLLVYVACASDEAGSYLDWPSVTNQTRPWTRWWWMDEHFTGTLGEAKRWVDGYFLGGINHICYHGTTFSPPEEDWPGWMFYASVHFGPTNSFWGHFSALNAYVTRCQSFLQMGQPDNDVLLYWPIHDSWSQRGRAMLQHYSAQTPREIQGIAQTLWQSGYSFDYVSDRQLAEVRCDNGILRTAGAAYRAVVIPKCRHIPAATFKTLLAMTRQGATIIVQEQLPQDVPGWGDLDVRRNALREMISELDLVEGSISGVREARLGRGRFLLGEDLDRLLSLAGVERESMVDGGLRFVRRTLSNGKCYCIQNSTDEASDGWVPLATEAAAVAIFEPVQGSAGLAAMKRNGRTHEIYLQLAPGQSCILRTFDTAVEASRHVYWSAKGAARPVEGTWTVDFVEGGPELPATVRTQTLGSWTDLDGEAVKRFSGTARYTIAVKRSAEQADGWLLDLGRVCESARVTLNGRQLGTFISAPFQIAIPADRLEDENTLQIEAANLMGNRIADLDRRGVNYKKFYNVNFAARRRENRGPDGNFNAAQWPLQDSGLIGPVTLTPLQTVTPGLLPEVPRP